MFILGFDDMRSYKEFIEERKEYDLKGSEIIKMDVTYAMLEALWFSESNSLTLDKISDEIFCPISVLSEAVDLARERGLANIRIKEPYKNSEVELTPKGYKIIDKVKEGTFAYILKKYKMIIRGD